MSRGNESVFKKEASQVTNHQRIWGQVHDGNMWMVSPHAFSTKSIHACQFCVHVLACACSETSARPHNALPCLWSCTLINPVTVFDQASWPAYKSSHIACWSSTWYLKPSSPCSQEASFSHSHRDIVARLAPTAVQQHRRTSKGHSWVCRQTSFASNAGFLPENAVGFIGDGIWRILSIGLLQTKCRWITSFSPKGWTQSGHR